MPRQNHDFSGKFSQVSYRAFGNKTSILYKKMNFGRFQIIRPREGHLLSLLSHIFDPCISLSFCKLFEHNESATWDLGEERSLT